MAVLRGAIVRHRVAAMDQDLDWLSSVTEIPRGTLKNVTRPNRPQETSLRRAYRISAALGLPIDQIVEESRNDGVPSEPPKQPKGPKGPTRRQEKDNKGPKRDHDEVAA